jgi:hypothetical protein
LARSCASLDASTLKAGQDVAYERVQPIVSSDYKIVSTSGALVATSDITLKSSWLTNSDFKITKGQVIHVAQELLMPDGTSYLVYYPVRDRVLFIKQDGEFCNQAMMVAGARWNWTMGYLSRPDRLAQRFD